MNYSVILCILLAFPVTALCERGKLILRSGSVLSGDINRLPSGAIRIFVRKGAVDFERGEISRIIFDARASAESTATRARTGSLSSEYDPLIHSAASRYGLDPDLVRAVICAESAFNPKDRSAAGACGLMQLMPATARLLGVRNIYSPSENILGGTRFLGYMLDQFSGDLALALAAYNAGPSVVRKYGAVPPYRETREYVRLVMNYYANAKQKGEMISFTDETGLIHISNAR